MVDSRMCSRLLSGSASRPSSASNPETTVETPVAQRRRIAQHRGRRRGERAQHRQRQARCSSRACRWRDRRHHETARCARGAWPHCSRPFLPRGRGLRGVARRPTRLCARLPPDPPTAQSPTARDSETSAAGWRDRPSDRCRSRARRRWRLLPAAQDTSPVLPLPVMPTQTAWVVRSLRVVEQQVIGPAPRARRRTRARDRTRRASRSPACRCLESEAAILRSQALLLRLRLRASSCTGG